MRCRIGYRDYIFHIGIRVEKTAAKQVTPLYDLYENGVVQYFAIVENISNERQDDVKVKTNLPEALSVSRLNLISGMEATGGLDDDLTVITSETEQDVETTEVTEGELPDATGEASKMEPLEYQDELDIGDIEPGQNKVISYDFKINKVQEEKPPFR